MSKVAKYILRHKLGGKEMEASECRILEVSLPATSSADIEFTNICMSVSEGFTSRSKLLLSLIHSKIPFFFTHLSSSSSENKLQSVSRFFKSLPII